MRAAPRPAPRPGLHLGQLLAQSWATMRAHPVIATAMGGAVLLSFASALFGVGLVTAPWFMCEIFALQLAVLTGHAPARERSWFKAGLLVFLLVSLVIAATWLAALGVGPDVASADHARAPLPWPDALARVGTIAGVTVLTVGFIAPFSYAPLILIERGGAIGAAVVESAWLVRRGGVARHGALVFLAHLVPLSPALVSAVVVARTFERAATPLGVLVALPLLPLTIPIGQGLLTASYVERRHELAEPRWSRAAARPPRALVALLGAVMITPILSLALLALGATRPAAPSPGRARGAIAVAAELPAEGPTEVAIPETTLRVSVDGGEVQVRSGDGEGDRAMRGPWQAPLRTLRVGRVRDVYDIELGDGAALYIFTVDRAAMRVDDSIGERLGSRLPWWALLLIALSFALDGLLLARALEPLGALRRAYGAPAHLRPKRDALAQLRAESLRRVWWLAVALALAGLTAAGVGLLAWLG